MVEKRLPWDLWLLGFVDLLRLLYLLSCDEFWRRCASIVESKVAAVIVYRFLAHSDGFGESRNGHLEKVVDHRWKRFLDL